MRLHSDGTNNFIIYIWSGWENETNTVEKLWSIVIYQKGKIKIKTTTKCVIYTFRRSSRTNALQCPIMLIGNVLQICKKYKVESNTPFLDECPIVC